MDALAYLLSIIVLAAVCGWLGWFALTLYHDREVRRITGNQTAAHQRHLENIKKLEFMDKAAEKGLPVPRYDRD